VLDLGCGTGEHVTAALASRYSVVGVDISARSVAAARRRVGDASFVDGDIASVAFRGGSFDAVVASFSLIHVPRELHAEVLGQIASWLRPGGWFVATMGADGGTDAVGDFLGVDMYWSSWGADTNIDLVQDAGLDVVSAVEHTEHDNGVIRHLWVVARRPQRFDVVAST